MSDCEWCGKKTISLEIFCNKDCEKKWVKNDKETEQRLEMEHMIKGEKDYE